MGSSLICVQTCWVFAQIVTYIRLSIFDMYLGLGLYENRIYLLHVKAPIQYILCSYTDIL